RLESLAGDRGKTIICTIKQPSSEVFRLFDKVVFLAQGRVAFHGAPDEAITFFAKCGFMLPDHTNPADHFTDYANSRYAKDLQGLMKAAEKPRSLRPHHGAGLSRLISALFVRYAKDNVRNKSVMRAKFVQKACMALFLGFLYFQTPADQDGVTNLKGILFFFCSELTYPTIYGIQTYMPGEFPLLVREYHNGDYPVLAYYVAKVLSYMPIFSMDGMILTSIAYWLIGLAPTATRFIRTVITGVLVEAMVASLGVAVCSMSPSYAVAVTITGPLLTIYSMTGGLFTNVAMLPDWIRWVQYLSWFRFGYEAFIINEWTYEKYNNISCTMTSGKVAESCEHSGAEVIE
ncbi:ABC-2 type transporter, partial [Teladorsagia circumcincta]